MPFGVLNCSLFADTMMLNKQLVSTKQILGNIIFISFRFDDKIIITIPFCGLKINKKQSVNVACSPTKPRFELCNE